MSDFVIENGVLKKYTGEGGDVVIPEGVTEIGASAFYWFKNLQSVVIPEGVTKIGWRAFSDCENLRSAVIPKGVTEIWEEAFSYCENLRSVVISEGVTKIGEKAFSWCTNLKSVEISEGVTEIGALAFYWCENLQSVVIPEGVTKIGERAFSSCYNLQNVVIPEGVTKIGDSAFSYCKNLQSVVIPEGVTKIGGSAFSGCENLQSVVIPEGVTEIGGSAFSCCTNLQNVVIPEGVTKIGEGAFSYCTNLQSVVIPEGVTEIGGSAFFCCKNLRSVVIPESVTEIGLIFGDYISELLAKTLEKYCSKMNDSAIKAYFLVEGIWKNIDINVKYDIFASHNSKSFEKLYFNLVTTDDAKFFGEKILGSLPEKASLKECNSAAKFVLLLGAKISDDLLNKFYSELKKQKNAAKALKSIEDDMTLSRRLGKEAEIDSSLPEPERKLAEILLEEKTGAKELEAKFKSFYSLTQKDLPAVFYKDGTKVPPMITEWLLSAHEKYDSYDVVAGYKNPGIRPEAKEILGFIDEESFQNALLVLANENLGLSGRSKKMFLAYPICRYADSGLMAELTKRAPKWSSSVSGNDAPPLYTFRKASMYSSERSAMFLAERYHELGEYARIHGTDEDTIRDKYLSETGLDAKGEKEYDLGNQKVIAKLQDDLSFVFVQENGKTAKSLPKKGADAEKFEAAKKDFDEIKKAVKKIVKSRCDILFEEFLSEKTKEAESWKNSYTQNPLLHKVATLLVWKQGKNTFTLIGSGAIDANGAEYVISDEPISVAHPMEMEKEDISAWQKYFVSHGLKQPFEQVWEPVVNPDDIKEDRYSGISLPILYFPRDPKHGIWMENLYPFSEEFELEAIDCSFETDYNIGRYDPYCSEEGLVEISNFKLEKYSRFSNHIAAYLDKKTVYGRIAKDDSSIIAMLPTFTLAQITEFIRIAQENNATNVTALLLNYKNENFGDFDPMAEFTLD